MDVARFIGEIHLGVNEHLRRLPRNIRSKEDDAIAFRPQLIQPRDQLLSGSLSDRASIGLHCHSERSVWGDDVELAAVQVELLDERQATQVVQRFYGWRWP